MNKGLLIIGSILAASVITTSCNNKQQGSNGISKADSTQVVEDEVKDEDAVKLTTKKITKKLMMDSAKKTETIRKTY